MSAGTSEANVLMDDDENLKKSFYKEFDSHAQNLRHQGNEKYILKQAVYKLAIKALTLPPKEISSDISAKFKHWARENLKIEKFGDEDVLFCRKRNLPVVTYENLFSVINECHVRTGHHGRDKTWIAVSHNYAWVPYKAIRLFLSMCKICKSRITGMKRPIRSSAVHRPLSLPPSRKAAIAVGFMTRLQVDVIDMTNLPDGDFSFIIHVRDLFSEFSWAFPTKNKSAKEVARHLLHIFSLFGPCGILQSDEGKEFVRNVIRELYVHWKGLVLVSGRSKNLPNQSRVEKDKTDFIVALEKWMEFNGPVWSRGLPHVLYAVNTNPSSRTGISPYEVVFTQKPHSFYPGFEELGRQGYINEEDLPIDVQLALAGDNSHRKGRSSKNSQSFCHRGARGRMKEDCRGLRLSRTLKADPITESSSMRDGDPECIFS